ncbi:MAG: ABC transporter permease [Candidatus Hermodarchaeota archaeon]
MNQVILDKGEKVIERKKSITRYIKFFLIPGWRDPELTEIEYKLGKTKSKRKLFRRVLTPLTIIGIFMILFIAFCAVFSPWLTPYPLRLITNPYLSMAAGFPAFAPPSPEHPLGTTIYGYDLLARLIWGSRTALTFGIVSISLGILGGLIVGTISGYFGGRVDSIIMRIADIIMVFPIVLIVIIFTQLGTQNIFFILFVFGSLSIPGLARFMRAVVLQVKQELYVSAAITGGAKKLKVMFIHILPNAISPLFIVFFGGVGGAILGFTSIAFLGFGDQTIPDWGTDINIARLWNVLNVAIWPGVFILIAVLGFMLVGDGLRDALDPRLYKRVK